MLRIFLIILLVLPILGFTQVKTIGTPNIQNYPKSVYKAATQNWGIAQDNNGFMYFANNDGLLCFDGLHWSLSKVSDSSPLRSVFVDNNNNMYVGLGNDFGLFTRNEPELPVFTSLKYLLPPECKEFEDIWRIHETSEGIVFQSYKYLFLYKNGKIEIIKPKTSFRFSFKIDNRLFVQEPNLGVFELSNGTLTQLPYGEKYTDKNISAILKTETNKLLICTERNGIYKFENGKIEKWNTPVSNFIEKNKLYSATTISGNYIAFGTILNGLVIADSDGAIIQVLNSTNGMQNNTILSSFADMDGNLWLGLDNGIDYVEINSPISFIGKASDLGSGYCCKVFNENLYLGTNQGLYVKPFNRANNNQPFELVANTAGQVWFLEEFNGQLICGHNLGTFVVEQKKARKISDIAGAWKYIRLKNNSDYLIGGHYDGLVLLKQGKNGWEFHKKLEGFTESSRYIKQSNDGEIWISHGTKGIFKIELDGLDKISKFEQYSVEAGLPSQKSNKLIEFNNELYISTINRVYKYDTALNRFIVAEGVNEKLTIDGRIKVLEEDEAGNLWFIADNETGVLRHNEDLTYTKIAAPFKKLRNKLVTEFEFIYPLNNENIFIGLDDGFAHYNSKVPKFYSESFSSFIITVEVPNIDSIFYCNSTKTKVDVELPFRKNALRFSFAAPFYENLLELKFSYYLENYSDDWSDWNTDNYKDFTNLWEGEYNFKVKALNLYGTESEIAEFRFEIKPPLYRSKIAYFIYIIFTILLIYILIRFILYRMEYVKTREKEKHKNKLRLQEEKFQHQALITEKEIIKLRNDKLRAEKVHRDKELANQTMGIIQKNKFLMRVNEELQRIQNSTTDATVITQMVLIKKRIKKELDVKQQNKLFETYFEDVHSDFFKRLKEKYPQLTPNDLKLCAYIRMNISTKEIATLLNISYRGVEISRYRLRKKIELSREINLSTFLSGI